MDTSQKTLWVGNLPDNITEELLYELFLQAGPLEKVRVPKERRYAFIQFKHEESVPYSLRIMDGISLFGNTLSLRARTDNPTPPGHRFNRNSLDNRRGGGGGGGGENNKQNRGSSPYDNSYPKNYDQYQNPNTSGHYGNNPKNFSNRQQWSLGMPHQALPNMQPSSGRRAQRRHHHDVPPSRSSPGDYKGGSSSYRHEPYRRY